MQLLEHPIEHGIPIPQGRSGRLQRLRDKLRAMEIGDSFVYDDRADCSNPHQAARQIGAKIKTTKLDGLGFRIWRIQ